MPIPANEALFLINKIQKPDIERQTSSVLDRVKQFLAVPASTKPLEDIEDVVEGEQFIEMNLDLGVFDVAFQDGFKPVFDGVIPEDSQVDAATEPEAEADANRDALIQSMCKPIVRTPVTLIEEIKSNDDIPADASTSAADLEANLVADTVGKRKRKNSK